MAFFSHPLRQFLIRQDLYSSNKPACYIDIQRFIVWTRPQTFVIIRVIFVGMFVGI